MCGVMFQLRHLKTFLAAAETLSFTRAAQRVHLSQPSVTEQIQALEDSLGRQLFVRNNNRLALTDAGRQLAVRARDLLAMAEDTLRSVRDGEDAPAETIAIAAPQTLCARMVAPAVAELADSHPGARIAIHETNSKATVQAVVEGTADLGLLHGWPAADAPVQARLLARDTPVVVVPRVHALGECANVSASMLAGLPLVATSAGCTYRAYLDALLQSASSRATIRAEADTVPSLLQLVAAGVGVAVLPRMAVLPAAHALQLQVRALDAAGEGLPICLLTPAARPLRAGAARLVEQICQVILASDASDQPVPALDVQHLAGGVAVAH
jgi:DNA-binding transcriptional LysR family regulator